MAERMGYYFQDWFTKRWWLLSHLNFLSGTACLFTPLQPVTILRDSLWRGSSVEVIREPPASSQGEIEVLSPINSKETTPTNNLVGELGSNSCPTRALG